MGLARAGGGGRGHAALRSLLPLALLSLLLCWLCLPRGAEAFVVGGRQAAAVSAATKAAAAGAAAAGGAGLKSPAPLHAVAVEQQPETTQQHHHHTQMVSAAEAPPASFRQRPQEQPQPPQPELQQHVPRTKTVRIAARDLRSPFVSVEVRPATRLEELLAVIDLRAECFAEQAGPLTVEAKLKHVKHVLARRARGAVVLVATARDLLSPFSGEVIVGSLECSTHEFEEGSPFVHDGPHARKLYVRMGGWGVCVSCLACLPAYLHGGCLAL